MHIPLSSTLTLAISLLSTTTLALPTSSETTTKRETSPSFYLTSQLKTHDTGNPAFQSLNLTSYHTGAGLAYAVLGQSPARIAHLNGTAADFVAHNTSLLFEGDQFPFGLVIPPSATEGTPVEINAGQGTKGVYIDGGVVQTNTPLDYPIQGGFYACNSTLPYGSAIQVFYRTAEGSTPAACSDIDLRVSYL